MAAGTLHQLLNQITILEFRVFTNLQITFIIHFFKPLHFSDEACEIDSGSSNNQPTNKEIEICVLRILTDATLSLPSDSRIICHNVSTQIGYNVSHTVVSNLLQKFAAQELIR